MGVTFSYDTGSDLGEGNFSDLTTVCINISQVSVSSIQDNIRSIKLYAMLPKKNRALRNPDSNAMKKAVTVLKVLVLFHWRLNPSRQTVRTIHSEIHCFSARNADQLKVDVVHCSTQMVLKTTKIPPRNRCYMLQERQKAEF